MKVYWRECKQVVGQSRGEWERVEESGEEWGRVVESGAHCTGTQRTPVLPARVLFHDTYIVLA